MVAAPDRESFTPTADAPRLARLGDLLGELEADALAAQEAARTGRARGPITGVPTLDRELGGYLAPGIHVIHGNVGAGKTALGLQIAATCGCPALFVSMEMARLELLRRVIARTTETYLGKLKDQTFTPAALMDKARAAAAAAPALVLADATLAYAS